MFTKQILTVIFTGAVLFVSCKKKEDPAPVKGEFSGSWVENDTSRTYNAGSSLFKIKYKLLTLFCSPSPGVTRNVNLYLTDTLAGTYSIGVNGTAGKVGVMMNGMNGPEGNFFFNSTSGTLIITEKQPTWISGTFEVTGNPTSGSLEKIKGSFKYAIISR